jgi:hypothetical protein
MRTIAMVQGALLAARLPPRFNRWRIVLPEDAGMGLTPHNEARARSLRSRSGLSPAATKSAAAVCGPTPNWVSKRLAAGCANCLLMAN